MAAVRRERTNTQTLMRKGVAWLRRRFCPGKPILPLSEAAFVANAETKSATSGPPRQPDKHSFWKAKVPNRAAKTMKRLLSRTNLINAYNLSSHHKIEADLL
jgi:hypothetical protein